MKKLRKLLMAGAMATTLTACGGGGGGAGGAVTNFVENDLTNLAGSETIINSYSSLLTGFNSTISTGNFAIPRPYLQSQPKHFHQHTKWYHLRRR